MLWQVFIEANYVSSWPYINSVMHIEKDSFHSRNPHLINNITLQRLFIESIKFHTSVMASNIRDNKSDSNAAKPLSRQIREWSA